MASFKTVVRDALFGGLIAGSGGHLDAARVDSFPAQLRRPRCDLVGARRRTASRRRFKWRFGGTPGNATRVRRASGDSRLRRRSCEASRRRLLPLTTELGLETPRGRAERPAPPPLAARLRPARF